MNRRSMLKTAIGACVAVILPCLAIGRAKGGTNRRMKTRNRLKQLRRIKRMIKKIHRDEEQSFLDLARVARECGSSPVCVERCDVDVAVDAMRPDTLAIRIETRAPRKEDGLYRCGMVLLTASLSESMDDEKLLHHMRQSLFIAMLPPYVSRQGLLDDFNGRPVVLTEESTSEQCALSQVIMTEKAFIKGNLDALGGLSSMS
jgi:hypothetical protein